MVHRRSLGNLRLKTQVFIFLIFIVFISLTLLYRALTTQDIPKSTSLFPTLEKRPVRFQPKFIPDFDRNDAEQQVLSHDEIVLPKAERSAFQNNEFISLKDRDLLNANSREALSTFLATLYPTNWKVALETDEVAFELKYLLLDYGFESGMSCKEIDALRIGNPISYSRSKYIEYAYPDGESHDYNSYYDGFHNRGNKRKNPDMAVKSPSSDQDTKIACMKQIYEPELCATMGNYRFLREVLLLNTLRHPSILAIKGYCLRGNSITSRLQTKGLILVTEVGNPITHSLIQTSSWNIRISMALQISQLLLFLERSPLGSLRFSKVQMKDFVLVKDKEVKLADFDDLELGEKSCSDDGDCVHQESGKGTSCSGGLCEGLNSLSNLDIVAKAILLPLLHPPQSKETTLLVEKLQKTDISAAKVASILNTVYNKSPHEEPPKRINIAVHREVDHMAIPRKQEKRIIQSEPKEPSLIIDDILTRFTRHNGKNFAGIYDYPCAGSRVNWGCVFTVTSLKQAATYCYKDKYCQGFIVFTTMPESETLMTVVLKNNIDSNPSVSSGTTLFIKKEQVEPEVVKNDDYRDENRPHAGKHKSNVIDREKFAQNDDNGDEDEDDEVANNISTEIQECLDRNQQTYESARFSREKRMMAHLGLKGIREQSWRISAFNQDLGSFSHIIRAEGGGGKLLTELVKRRQEDKEQIAKKATFMAEDGPKLYHVAYTWVYHIDRLLGFYHTPPCVGKILSSAAVETLHASFSWEETFRPLIESDGTLTGILLAPIPKVMSLSKLVISPLQEMVTEVVSFDRQQKLQLEYVLLWWLGGMNKADNEYLGYKGHLIHFHADKAFVNTSVDLSNYLNHCQFPNVAYKSLMCFRCRKDSSANICHFAEEAANRVQAMFDDEVELDLHQKTESRLTRFINQVATSIVHRVDSCIKKFGREKVIY